MNVLKRLSAAVVVLACLPGAAMGAEDENGEDPTVFTQGEVVVIGRRTPAEQTQSFEEITAEDIRALGATNVAEALQSALGMRVDTAATSLSANGKQESLGSLRGFDPRHVIVLVDGIPVYEPFFRVLDLRQIPVGDVAKIQVVKGPTSVLYGPNALGGIINIITRRGAGAPRGHVDATYGDVGHLAGNASVLGGTGRFDYFLAPGFAGSEGVRVSNDFEKTRNEDGKVRENSDFQDRYLSGKAGYSEGFNAITLSANHYAYEGGVPFSMEATEPATLWRKDWRKTSAAIYGSLAPAPWLPIRANAYYTRFFNTIETYTDAGMSAIADEGNAVSTYDNNVFGYHLLPEFLLGRAGSVTLSLIYKGDRVATQDEDGGPWFRFGAETYSAGAQYGWEWRSLSATVGAAGHLFRKTRTPDEDLGEDTSTTDFQAGLAFSPGRAVRLHTGVAKKSSFPDLRSLYGSNGNPELKSESAVNADLGADWKPASFLALASTGFYSDIEDLIGKKELGNSFEYENVDDASITGVESSLETDAWKKRLSLRLTHTWMDTRDERPDRRLKRLDFRPEHMAAADARAAFPFGASIDLQYRYVGERPYEEPGKDRIAKSLPEYGATNARVAWRFAWDDGQTSAEWSIQAKNLFDVYYEDSPEKASAGRMLYTQIGMDFQ